MGKRIDKGINKDVVGKWCWLSDDPAGIFIEKVVAIDGDSLYPYRTEHAGYLYAKPIPHELQLILDTEYLEVKKEFSE